MHTHENDEGRTVKVYDWLCSHLHCTLHSALCSSQFQDMIQDLSRPQVRHASSRCTSLSFGWGSLPSVCGYCLTELVALLGLSPHRLQQLNYMQMSPISFPLTHLIKDFAALTSSFMPPSFCCPTLITLSDLSGDHLSRLEASYI